MTVQLTRNFFSNARGLTLLDSGGTTWTINKATNEITVATAGGGTVTSVALADGSGAPIYAVSGSPIVGAGTLTLTLSNQTANKVFAGPTGGGAAQPTFRALVAADLPAGAAGATGSPGPPGDDGLDGDHGPPGDRGAAGSAGAAGSTGPPGPPGDDGLDGDHGPPGERGITGATGSTGAPGTPGPPGDDGLDGDHGPPGERGITGVAGTAGAVGFLGPPGEDGMDGDHGPPGERGITGSAGAAGATGTLGPPGDDGLDGDTGPPGERGLTGATGAASTIVGPQGPPGEDGMDGDAGPPGPSVLTANPTGLVGLTAVNGTLSTVLRSDAAPPIDQAIVPSWTQQHTFTKVAASGSNVYSIEMVSNSPAIGWTESDAGADATRWENFVNASVMTIRIKTDAGASARNAIAITRVAGAITDISLGNAINSSTYNLLGTGLFTVGGAQVIGAPTGGSKGTGTLNATGLFINGVAVNTTDRIGPPGEDGMDGDTGPPGPAGVALLYQSYTPGSITVPTGYFMLAARRQQWTGTERLRLIGTARLSIGN